MEKISAECTRSLHGAIVPFLMYGCETKVHIGQKRLKIREGEICNLKIRTGIRKTE